MPFSVLLWNKTGIMWQLKWALDGIAFIGSSAWTRSLKSAFCTDESRRNSLTYQAKWLIIAYWRMKGSESFRSKKFEVKKSLVWSGWAEAIISSSCCAVGRDNKEGIKGGHREIFYFYSFLLTLMLWCVHKTSVFLFLSFHERWIPKASPYWPLDIFLC